MNLLALNPMTLFSALPGNIAQGMIWGIMAIGVYMTFRLLHPQLCWCLFVPVCWPAL